MLGALFVLVTLLLPKGIVGTVKDWWERRQEEQLAKDAASAALEDGIAETRMAE
jgi:urea transport system permease protein